MTTVDDPRHPALPDAWRYKITGFRYERPNDGDEPFLELTLRAGTDVRCLRFLSPQNIEVRHGFEATGGLVVLDVRARGLSGLGVRVEDREGGEGGVEFWARDVEDLSATPLRAPA
jgi:hypothetical protein